MAIPKYITHPLLLLTFGVVVASFVWIKLPSQQTLETTKIQVQNTAAQHPIDPNELIKIETFLAKGCLVMGQDTAYLLCLTDAKLQNLTGESLSKMQNFFHDKWIRKSLITAQTTSLPLELWDASCLTASPESAPTNLCPMVLSP